MDSLAVGIGMNLPALRVREVVEFHAALPTVVDLVSSDAFVALAALHGPLCTQRIYSSAGAIVLLELSILFATDICVEASSVVEEKVVIASYAGTVCRVVLIACSADLGALTVEEVGPVLTRTEGSFLDAFATVSLVVFCRVFA